MSVGLIYALHGFLGESADWQEVRKHLNTTTVWCAKDLFKNSTTNVNAHLVEKEISQLLSQSSHQASDKTQVKKIFLGYSFGGRLGLKLLSENAELFDHYIFVSVNSGFKDSDVSAKEQRLSQDKAWSAKISTENWDHFIVEWNQQLVFSGGVKEPERKLENFDLDSLKEALVEQSLAKQADYSDLIRQHSKKITWIVGDRDSKFRSIAENLKIDYLKIKSGHRILFDNPVSLALTIDTIITT